MQIFDSGLLCFWIAAPYFIDCISEQDFCFHADIWLYGTNFISTSMGCVMVYLVFLIAAPYFIDCISEQDLDEMNIELIRNTLYKVWYCLMDMQNILIFYLTM